MKKPAHSIEVDVAVLILKDGNAYVAYCPALNISSYGSSAKDAKAAFDENMKIFLSETLRKGTLEKYLLKLGWMLQQIPEPFYKPPAFPVAQQNFLKSSQVLNEKI